MARVTHEGFKRLSDPNYRPPSFSTDGDVEVDVAVELSMMDLLDAGVLRAGDYLIPRDTELEVIAEVTEEGLIALDDHSYDNPNRAARAIASEHEDGWTYWLLANSATPRSLRDLADLVHARNGIPVQS